MVTLLSATGFLAFGLQEKSAEVPVTMAVANAQPKDNDNLAGADVANRRTHLRLSAYDVLWLQGVRIKYGADVRVIDISAGGILVETASEIRSETTIVFE